MRQWDVKKEAALSRITEQRMNKEAVEAENAANNAKLAEHLVHVSTCKALGHEAACIYEGRAALGTPYRLSTCVAALQLATNRVGRRLAESVLGSAQASLFKWELSECKCLVCRQPDFQRMWATFCGYCLCFPGQTSIN